MRERPHGHPVGTGRLAADSRVSVRRRSEEVIDRYTEPGGQPGEVVESEPPLTGLQSTQRRGVDVGSIGDLLQGEPSLRPDLPQSPADADIDRLLWSVCLHSKPYWQM